MKKNNKPTKAKDMTAMQAIFAPEVTQLSAGYHTARNKIADIFEHNKLGKKGAPAKGSGHDDEWYINGEQLRMILDYVTSHELLAKSSLIKVRKIDGEDYLKIDDVIVAMILDSIIGEGNYKLNHLQSIRRNPHFLNDNWYRFVEKLQWLLFDKLDN